MYPELVLPRTKMGTDCFSKNIYQIATEYLVLCIYRDVCIYHIILRTIHLRRRQFFTIFDPYPPIVGSFLVQSISKFGKFLTPTLRPLLNKLARSTVFSTAAQW